MALFGRLNEASQSALKDHVRPLFAKHGLQGGEFDVLATLRRSGPPYALNPTALYEATMVTSGAMTARLDKLEKAGWIERRRDSNDRRGTIIVLTPAGLGLMETLVPLHVANQARLLAGLTSDERTRLTELLGKLVQGINETNR